jgi:hypothetical protein
MRLEIVALKLGILIIVLLGAKCNFYFVVALLRMTYLA